MSIDWDGEGLPPAYTKCEFQPWKEHSAEWKEITVIAHWRAPNGITYSWGHTGYGWKEPQAMRFRKIRTPEQIAAEERNNGIDAILDAYEYTVGPCTHKLTYSQAMRLYDAGIRKVTP